MANNIRRLADERNLNPTQLSRRADITYRMVLDYYKAPEIQDSIKLGTLRKLANALGVTVSELLRNGEEAKSS